MKLIEKNIKLKKDAMCHLHEHGKVVSKMKLTWLKNEFICKELYAPFKIDKDTDYRNDLEKKYKIVMEQAKKANADDESLKIIDLFSTKILESLDLYYKADIADSNNIILELVKNIGDNPFAVNTVINSDAFPELKLMSYNSLEVD